MARRYVKRSKQAKEMAKKSSRKNKPGAGRPPEYSPEQIDAMLGWLAEGLTEGEINNRAAEFTPAFKMSPQLLYHYRKTREIDVSALREEKEFEALRTGLSIKANRLQALYRLAKRLEDDIELRKRLWLDRTKSIVVGPMQWEKITEKEFINNLVRELRGVYADIAAETGGRIMKADITSAGKAIKGYVGISPEDWDSENKEDI